MLQRFAIRFKNIFEPLAQIFRDRSRFWDEAIYQRLQRLQVTHRKFVYRHLWYKTQHNPFSIGFIQLNHNISQAVAPHFLRNKALGISAVDATTFQTFIFWNMQIGDISRMMWSWIPANACLKIWSDRATVANTDASPKLLARCDIPVATHVLKAVERVFQFFVVR